MYYCNDCDHLIGELIEVTETNGEQFQGCPFCGSDRVSGVREFEDWNDAEDFEDPGALNNEDIDEDKEVTTAYENPTKSKEIG